jgi:hypothetical protein
MEESANPLRKGRGAQFNPANRFERLAFEPDDSLPEEWGEAISLKTQFYAETPKNIISEVKSPDVPMLKSINPYQGCEHGCIYCYARNAHEYWGFSAGLDFESRIMVKKNAA